MDILHDMKKYRTGRSPEGHELLKIPLKADEDDMIGRECPNEDCQPKYFKMSGTIPDEISKKIEDFAQIDVTCPYCGTVDNMQHYHTKNQIEWFRSMMLRYVAKTLQNRLESSFKSMSRTSKGMITYKPGHLPSVRHYVEEKLKKTVVCDDCGFSYAVYGISFCCPLCGEGNLIQHLNRSANIIRALLEEHKRISQERGQEVGHQMVGNALEDVVGLFEAFLKYIYQYEIKRRFSKEEAEAKILKIRANFQRLEAAKDLFSKDLGFTLFSECDQEDETFLQEQFLKRHVITHNLGLVDRKYIEKAQAYEKQGAELDINPIDVSKALKIVVGVVNTASQCLEKPN